MTDREKAIVAAYTGITMLTGDKLSIFYAYIESLLGRPVYTHELACEGVWKQIKEKSKNDFLKLCADEERPQGDLISRSELKKELESSKYIVPNSLNRLLNSEINRCIEAIDNAPTVERPIRGIAKMDKNGNIEIELLKLQGKWIEFKGGYYKCDNCGEVERAKKNFCSNCGVKMINC